MYSCGEVRGSPQYLVVISTVAQQLGSVYIPLRDFVVEGLTERLHHRDAEQVRRDYLDIVDCRDQYPFKVHSALDNVPRSVLETATEQELANRARPLFSRFVKGLTRSEGHFGDVSILGAHPLIPVEELSDFSPGRDGRIYKVRPFPEALAEYPQDRFHVPYDVSLDLEGFRAWTLNCRVDFGGHTTLVNIIEQSCLPISA